jgi:phosphomannomutase
MNSRLKMKLPACKKKTLQNWKNAFYRNLEFGTGGLRGIMGIGTNRMNKYTVGMATQGFANYIKNSFKEKLVLQLRMIAATTAASLQKQRLMFLLRMV